MKKFIIPLLVLGIFSCTNNAPIKNNNNLPVSTNKVENLQVVKSSQAEIKFSFSVKDVASTLRVKSVDVYLVDAAGLADPTTMFIQKTQVDVVDGVVSAAFANVPAGGPYYAVIQAFDNTVPASPPPSPLPERNLLTKPNPSASNYPVDISSNSVTSTGSTLTYSTGTALNVVINLVPYNNANSNVEIQNGSNTPTGSIVPTEVSPTPWD
jgi:hypothetical protein